MLASRVRSTLACSGGELPRERAATPDKVPSLACVAFGAASRRVVDVPRSTLGPSSAAGLARLLLTSPPDPCSARHDCVFRAIVLLPRIQIRRGVCADARPRRRRAFPRVGNFAVVWRLQKV